jgi:hypothetical protein
MTPPKTPKRAPSPKNRPRTGPRSPVRKTPPPQVTAATTDTLRVAAGALLTEYLEERPIADTAARIAILLWRAEQAPFEPSDLERQLETLSPQDLEEIHRWAVAHQPGDPDAPT